MNRIHKNLLEEKTNIKSKKSSQSSTALTQTQPTKDNKRKKELIERFAQRYEIRPELANRISILENYELVILCDDSSSMNTPIHGTTTNRWDELRQFVHIIIDIYAVFDADGVDVYFLNRPSLFKVKDTKNVYEAFNKPSNGLTPMVPVLRAILQAKHMDKKAKQNLLIVIATDGVPTDHKGELDIAELEKVMRNERTSTTHVTFFACTDEPKALDYLNDWDRTMENVDVVDDFRSELAQIRQKQGNNIKFSYGDYLIKALVGSIDPGMDSLDE